MSDYRTPPELWSYFIYMYMYSYVLGYVLLRVCEIKCLHSALYKEGIYMKSISSPMENQ